jgi:hypothetical protein
LAAHAVRGQDEPELVIVERYPASIGEESLARLEEDTKSLIALDHTNIATLIYGVRMKGDLAVLSEWVDGESLESALAAPSKPSLDAILRIVVDACEGLSALHAFEGGKFVCGALGPDDVFLGVDGVTRITRFNLGRMPPDALGEKRRASMAPEFTRGDRTPRADVFAAGKLLAACLGTDRGALAPVIDRATAEDPAARYATVKELSQAIGVASKVATRVVVSQYVAKTFGQQIETRLAKLEPKVGISLSMTPPPVSAAPPSFEEPRVEPPKILPPPVIEPPKPEAKKPEPKPLPKIELKPLPKIEPKAEAKSEPKLPLEKKKEPEKKEPAKIATPAVAKKAVPLPSLGKKTNGTQPATPAKSAVAPKKEEKVEAIPPPPPPIEVPITISEPPPPSAQELDLADVDLASVKPPPLIQEAKIDIDVVEVSPKAVSVVPMALPVEKTKSVEEAPPKAKVKSVRPPKATSLRPAKEVKAAPAVPVDDEEEIASPAKQRSGGTSPLVIFLGVIVIGGAAFVAGRMTADVPMPLPSPLSPPTTTATSPATSATGTASSNGTASSPTSTPTSTSTSTATSTSTSSTSTSSSSAAATSGANTIGSPSASTSHGGRAGSTPSASGSGRYSPGAI